MASIDNKTTSSSGRSSLDLHPIAPIIGQTVTMDTFSSSSSSSSSAGGGSSIPQQAAAGKFLDSVPVVARRMLLAEHDRFTNQAKREMENDEQERLKALEQQQLDQLEVVNLTNQYVRSNYFVPSRGGHSNSRGHSTSTHNSHRNGRVGSTVMGHRDDGEDNEDDEYEDNNVPYDINQQDFDFIVNQEKLQSAVTTLTISSHDSGTSSGASSSNSSHSNSGSGSSSSSRSGQYKRSHEGHSVTKVIRLYEPEILRPSVYVKFVKLYKSLFNQHDSTELMNSLYYPCCNADMINMRKFWIRIPLPPMNSQAMGQGHRHSPSTIGIGSSLVPPSVPLSQQPPQPPRVAAQMVHCTQITGLQNVKENMKVDFMTHPDCVLQIQETRVFYAKDGCVRSASRFIFTATKITYHTPATPVASSSAAAATVSPVASTSSASRAAALAAEVSDDDREDGDTDEEPEPVDITTLSSTTSAITSPSTPSVTMEEVNMEGYFMVHYDKQNRVCQVETNIFKSLV